MRILYNPNHSLSNIICRIAHKISQGNSGGPRAGFFCQELFAPIVQNYRKFAAPCRGLPQLSHIIVGQARPARG